MVLRCTPAAESSTHANTCSSLPQQNNTVKIPTQKQAVVSAFNHGSGSPRKRQSLRPCPWVVADLDRRSHLTLCSTADLLGVTLHVEKKEKKIRNVIREMIPCCTSRFSWTHAWQRLGSGKAAVCCTVAEWRTLSRLRKTRIPQETPTHPHTRILFERRPQLCDGTALRAVGSAPVNLPEGPIQVPAPSHCRGWTDSLSDWKPVLTLLVKLSCS